MQFNILLRKFDTFHDRSPHMDDIFVKLDHSHKDPSRHLGFKHGSSIYLLIHNNATCDFPNIHLLFK